MRIDFTIPGPPKGKARARTLKNGFSYTPKDTVSYENLVKMCFHENRPAGWKPYEGHVNMAITAYFPIPKSKSKKDRERIWAGTIRPTVRPDWDNIGKIITDALNGIAYRDDAQIVDCRVYKLYDEAPKVRVTMEFCEYGKVEA